MSYKKHHTFVLFITIAALFGLGYWAYSIFRNDIISSTISDKRQAKAPSGLAQSKAPASPPLSVETVTAVAKKLVLDATAVGSLRSNESVVLRPETAGRIASINFKDGSTVAKGSLLIGLDASMQAAEYDQAKANLGLAQMNLRRSRELFEKKFVSQQALDNVEATLKVQEAILALADAKLEKTRIKAPFSGIVGIRNVSVGDYVKEGQELFNIEDIRTLKIDFRLPESYLGQLKPGQMLEVMTDALPGHTFEANIEAINPLIDTSGRAISCRASLSNADGRLRPGMFVRVRLILERRDNVLMLPEQAVVPDMKAPYVYRIKEGKAARVTVKTGLRRNAQVEIVDGLQTGDEIVVAGQMNLRDGAPVKSVPAPGGASVSATEAGAAATGATE